VKFARIILANLFRKKVRLFLTVGSFTVALFLFAFLVVVSAAFRFGADTSAADRLIVANRASYLYSIPLSYKNKIVAIPGVKFITYSSWFAGVYQDGKDPFGGLAIDPQGQRQVYPEFILPDEQWRAFLNDRQGAIAGAKVAAHFHWKIGDRIPFTETANGAGVFELNLVGIYHGKRPQDNESQFWLRWDYFNEKVPAYSRWQVGWYVLRVENASDSARIAKAIDQIFANSPNETKTQVESVFVADLLKQFTNIQSLIVLIGAVVFLTLLLVTGNTLAIAVRERTREFAIFKALGFSDFTLLSFVLVESLVPAMLGGALGLGLAWMAMPVVAKLVNGILPNLAVSYHILLLGLLTALLFGTISGVIPGIIAMRMRLINAVRAV